MSDWDSVAFEEIALFLRLEGWELVSDRLFPTLTGRDLYIDGATITELATLMRLGWDMEEIRAGRITGESLLRRSAVLRRGDTTFCIYVTFDGCDTRRLRGE